MLSAAIFGLLIITFSLKPVCSYDTQALQLNVQQLLIKHLNLLIITVYTNPLSM